MEWDVLEWMTSRLTQEKAQRASEKGNLPDDGPVAKTFTSMTLRAQAFLDLSIEAKIEWLDRKILHRTILGNTPKGTAGHEAWKKLANNNTKEGAEAVKKVCAYTKKLVSSVKQMMRVLFEKAEKDFPKDPQTYHALIPYPGHDYDPTKDPYTVEQVLFDLGGCDDGWINRIWGYLRRARLGEHDAKLISCYGAPR